MAVKNENQEDGAREQTGGAVDSLTAPTESQRAVEYVYVVEQGCYSDRGIVGVYATPDDAMADNPEPSSKQNRVRDGGWQPDQQAESGYAWDNGYDWDDAKDITRYEVQRIIAKAEGR